jgi:hypothetical protein
MNPSAIGALNEAFILISCWSRVSCAQKTFTSALTVLDYPRFDRGRLDNETLITARLFPGSSKEFAASRCSRSDERETFQSSTRFASNQRAT